LNLLEDSGVISHPLPFSFRREREGRVALGPVSRGSGKEAHASQHW